MMNQSTDKIVSTQYDVTTREIKLYSDYLYHKLRGMARLSKFWPLPTDRQIVYSVKLNYTCVVFEVYSGVDCHE